MSVHLFVAVASSLIFSCECTCPPNMACISMCLKLHVSLAQLPHQCLPVFSHQCLCLVCATFSPSCPISPLHVPLTQ
jgi:hypothetical protein